MSSIEGIRAFDTKANEEVWKIDNKIPWIKKELSTRGLTTGGRDRLSVDDENNNCIQEFRMADGKYIGVAFKKREGLWCPESVHWTSMNSHLNIVHYKTEYYISAIKVS